MILEVDPNLTTLVDFRYRRKYKAQDGEDGGSFNRFGKDAPDLIIGVPPGTILKDPETDEILADMTVPGQRVVVAKGGRGGRGNTRFKSPTRQAPQFAEQGLPGWSRELVLELKLLADVGLVGYPNVGKSTFISRISAAKPKIADYPFTTLVPNLGVVSMGEGNSFVVADIPGLIEGAHAGVGLGHEFLRHVERCRVLVHMIDMSGYEGRDPREDYRQILYELEQYSPELAQRPQIVVANKMDLPNAAVNLEEFRREYPQLTVYEMSAATGQGIDAVLSAMWSVVREMREAEPVKEGQEVPEVLVLEPAVKKAELRDFTITQDDEDEAFVVKGQGLEGLMLWIDFNNEESVKWFLRLLEDIGVVAQLREAGIEDGDTVRVGEYEFEFVD